MGDPNRFDLYLKPGELFFGRAPMRVKTLLGSCVAITLWHPVLRIGGMCHYVLPSRREDPSAPFDARYGNEAMAILAESMSKARTRPGEYETRLFGGGNMFPDADAQSMQKVGDRNIEIARELVREYGLRLLEEDVGGYAYRNVLLDLDDGQVDLKAKPIRA